MCFGFFFWWLSFGDFISINTHLHTHTHTIFIWVSRSQFGASKEEEVEEEAANKKATWPARSKRFTHFFLARSFSCNSYALAPSLSLSLVLVEILLTLLSLELFPMLQSVQEAFCISRIADVCLTHAQFDFCINSWLFFQVPVIVPVCVCVLVCECVYIVCDISR